MAKLNLCHNVLYCDGNHDLGVFALMLQQYVLFKAFFIEQHQSLSTPLQYPAIKWAFVFEPWQPLLLTHLWPWPLVGPDTCLKNSNITRSADNKNSWPIRIWESFLKFVTTILWFVEFCINPIKGTDEVQESSFALFARLYWKYNKTNAIPSDLIWFLRNRLKISSHCISSLSSPFF